MKWSVTVKHRLERRIKLANCPIHGSQCKAQVPEVFMNAHAGIPKLELTPSKLINI